MLLRSNFSSFPHYFIYIFLPSGVKLHIHLLNVVVQFIVFLTLSTLICRSTDISKCFSESLGIRDNGSRLYMNSDRQTSANSAYSDKWLALFATQLEYFNHITHVGTLRKHAYSNILKILPPKNGNFSDKKSDFFIFLLKNIDCGYLLELPQ